MVSAWGIVGIASAMLCSEGKKGEGVNESAQNPSLRNKLTPFLSHIPGGGPCLAYGTVKKAGRLRRLRLLRRNWLHRGSVFFDPVIADFTVTVNLTVCTHKAPSQKQINSRLSLIRLPAALEQNPKGISRSG